MIFQDVVVNNDNKCDKKCIIIISLCVAHCFIMLPPGVTKARVLCFSACFALTQSQHWSHTDGSNKSSPCLIDGNIGLGLYICTGYIHLP